MYTQFLQCGVLEVIVFVSATVLPPFLGPQFLPLPEGKCKEHEFGQNPVYFQFLYKKQGGICVPVWPCRLSCVWWHHVPRVPGAFDVFRCTVPASSQREQMIVFQPCSPLKFLNHLNSLAWFQAAVCYSQRIFILFSRYHLASWLKFFLLASMFLFHYS